MTQTFDYFVVFAEMRTGSNFLEANLNLFDGITCHGEAFNPHFIAYPNRTELLGMSHAERDAAPAKLVTRIKNEPGTLGGFRYFHDHDPRILEDLLDDPRCAKIVLTRNPVDSYVSWKIAQATDQWKLTNVEKRKASRARFQEVEFDSHVADLQAFQIKLLNALQHRGQTAFYLGYDDLGDVTAMNGLARWLGVAHQIEALDGKMKRQNPEPLSAKVENFEEMERALSQFDRFNLSRTPNFEPRRGPVVPGYVAAAQTPLLYLPIRGGPESSVLTWLAALDGVEADALQSGFSQKTLRQWLRSNPGHRRFTVLRHPVARAHHVFCQKILSSEPGAFKQIRRKLVNRHGFVLPDDSSDSGYDLEAHRGAFKDFLRFLKQNLDLQTNIRVDAHWCSQTVALQGLAEFAMPDVVVREEAMAAYLPAIAQETTQSAVPDVADAPKDAPYTLWDIYDAEIETLTRQAYQRDYIHLGFSDWKPT
ncbi:MAG: sulfotransferase domain-containing protein [Marinovum sp.]|nr:sulfotransferase domain-containing protein [Marinovum sp.]